MRCEDLESYLADYIENCLEDRVRSEVEEHLHVCPHCREEVASFSDTWIQGRAVRIAPPDSEAMRSTFDAMLNTYKQGVHRSRRSMRRQVLQVLVAVTVLGIAVFAAQRTGLIVMRIPGAVKFSEPPPAPVPPPQVIVAPARGSIEGVVLRVGSNEPVAGAEVTAFWAISPAMVRPEAIPRATTDREGRFIIRDLEPGGYRVSVSARTFSPQVYGRKEPGLAIPGTEAILDVAAGKAVTDVVVRLTPAGVISGRILSEKGEPLLGMEVVVMRSSYDVHGWHSLTAETYRALTNDRGEYRVPGISPGEFYVRASSAAEINGNMETARMQYIGLPAPYSYGKYQTVYYPHELDIARASLIEIREGSERAAVDFVLSRRFENRSVRGVVIDPSGMPFPRNANVRLDLDGAFASVIGGRVAINFDGTFDIHDVLPGTYWVVATLPTVLSPEQQELLRTSKLDRSQLPKASVGRTRITVGDSNVDGVVVTIARDLAVTGHIVVDGAPSPSAIHLENINIEFLGVEVGALRFNPTSGRVNTDGTFRYESVSPLEYLVWFSGIPLDAYLKEARLGETNLLTDTVLITEPPTSEMKVVLGFKAGTVAGTVNSAEGAGKQVVLIPDDPAKRRDLYKTATTDRNGRFVIRGIAPGDYRLFAWDNLESFRYFDPDFVKQFESEGTAVHVSQGVSIAANVRLIP